MNLNEYTYKKSGTQSIENVVKRNGHLDNHTILLLERSVTVSSDTFQRTLFGTA